MSQLCISTCVASDTEAASSGAVYPWMGAQTPQKRRLAYWKNAVTALATVRRTMPNAHTVLYANDQLPVIYKNQDLRIFCDQIGIEIIYLPYEKFIPPANFSKRYRNAYYKLDTLWHMANHLNAEYFIQIDNDCVWANGIENFEQILEQENSIWVYDIHKAKSPFIRTPDGVSNSMDEFGTVFKQINPNYPTRYPIWYGGEFIAASKQNLKTLSTDLEKLYNYLINLSDRQTFVFSTGRTLFDGDELMLTYVLGLQNIPIKECSHVLKRIITHTQFRNVNPEDVNLPVWHLPGEKHWGLNLLLDEALQPASAFWQTPTEKFNLYLGDYLSIPERKHWPKQPNKYIAKINSISKKLNNFLKS